ncbi:hypothetical protein [Tenacibaculum maritimum]|uniref:hypothetical protein n=1 Tax=Tenacibaculum maritimum TaxID=107401 RepID=UPI0012E5520C|nr:hypothetical protein [Tenacibaculum maritimum]CAA0152234.1 conserved hypothetical protein [Tenacibaculum maritimum]
MTELRTVYTVKGKKSSIIWEFEYDLNGVLRAFKLVEGELTEVQRKWLFFHTRFPYTENAIKSWDKSYKNFELIVGQPDLSFDAFWALYNRKVGKLEAERAWKRLNKSDQLKAIKQIKAYDGMLRRKRIEKVHPATYLNKRRFDDEFNSIH